MQEMLKESVDSTSISRSSEKQSTSIQHQNKASIPSASTQDPTHPPILDHRKEGNDFFESARLIKVCPLFSSENYKGNYNIYVSSGIEGIIQLQSLDYTKALKDPTIYPDLTAIERCCESDKKVLLLDLDETLIHSDFNQEFPSDSYDAHISFIDDEEEFSVGIFIRKGFHQFLKEISKYFIIGIFTASVKPYADAVINHIDPNQEYIKFRLYRNNCITVKEINIKDLRIFKDIVKQERIVIVDNSIYSFANQLSNGILINSFFNDKEDIELLNVMSYLLTFIVNTKDVREVNETFFGFSSIAKQIAP